MIEWRERKSLSGESGYLGEITVWSIGYNGIRRSDDPNHYTLWCSLPGVKDHVGVESPEAGKERAERQLQSWLKRTGLTPATSA